MDKNINVILRDPYADNLLLNMLDSKPASLIIKDAYAEDLLYNIKEKKAIKILPGEKVISKNGDMPK